MNHALEGLLGTKDAITWYQMCLRAMVVFAGALVLVRLGGKRAFGKNTSFDIVLGVILGSVLSRAVTGNAPLLPTLAASAALTLLHLALARLAFHSRRFGRAIKGSHTCLLADGKYQRDAMHRTSMTEHDLQEGARLRGHDDVTRLRAIYLERNGELSIVTPDG